MLNCVHIKIIVYVTYSMWSREYICISETIFTIVNSKIIIQNIKI